MKYIDPQTFAQMIDHRHASPHAEPEQHQNGDPSLLTQAIGQLVMGQTSNEFIKKKLVNYMTDVLADDRSLYKQKEVNQFVRNLGPLQQPAHDVSPRVVVNEPQPAANVFTKKHEYIPEFYAPPAQQVRHATEEDIERLRNSMDDSTNKLTPKQMAFWDRISATTKEAAKGNKQNSPNMNQVLVKYDSIPPEQQVVFDPGKSFNLMVSDADPDNSAFKLY